jgi:hypothetical protein
MNLKKKQFAAGCFGVVFAMIWLGPIFPGPFMFSAFMTGMLAAVAGIIATCSANWDNQ